MKTFHPFLAFIFTILLFGSCDGGGLVYGGWSCGSCVETDDEESLVLKPEITWRYKDEYVSRILPDSRQVITFSQRPGILRLRDVATGELIWSWEDFFETWEWIEEGDIFISNDIVFFSINNKYYSVDLNTGKTLWKRKEEGYPIGQRGELAVSGDLYFQVGSIKVDSSKNQEALFVGNIHQNDSMEFVFAPEFQQEITPFYSETVGSISDIITVEGDQGDLLLLMAYAEPNANRVYKNYFGLWNYTRQQWEYKDVPVVLGNSHIRMEKLGNYVYCYTRLSYRCYDLRDGSFLWGRENSQTSFSEVAYRENYLMMKNDLYELELIEPGTGMVVLSKPNQREGDVIIGSRFAYHKEETLNIFEESTGKLLTQLDSPYEEGGKENYFLGVEKIYLLEKEAEADLVMFRGENYLFGM